MSQPARQTMLYVIAYDIPHDGRRTKVHKTLSGVGRWTQFSLFEAFLTEKELIVLRGKLDKLLKEDEDSVRFYRLCAACVEAAVTIGSAAPKEEKVFVV
jgi:CRISPR-associated protein Cas2